MEERKRTKELCRVGEKIFARNFRESIAYLQEKYTKEEEWEKVERMLKEAWEEGKKERWKEKSVVRYLIQPYKPFAKNP